MDIILQLLSDPIVFPLFILLFVGIAFFVFRFASKRLARLFSIICTCVWGFALLYVTWLSRTPILETRINLIPFQPDINTSIFDYIANLAMFIPYPILLYGIVQKKLSFLFLSATGIGLSLVLELLQLITHRGVCDVEDLILNSAGVILGALFTALLMKTKQKN